MAEKSMQKVELHPAHVWTCDLCRRDNFCRGVVAEINPDERDEMIDADIAPEHAMTGEWLKTVTCAHCHAEFTVEQNEYGD
jgi:hypothetical protein